MLEILWNISVKYCETAHLETVFGRSSLKVLLNTTSAPKLFSPAFLTILSSFWPLFFGGCFFHSSLSLNFLKHVTWINVIGLRAPQAISSIEFFPGAGETNGWTNGFAMHCKFVTWNKICDKFYRTWKTKFYVHRIQDLYIVEYKWFLELKSDNF